MTLYEAQSHVCRLLRDDPKIQEYDIPVNYLDEGDTENDVLRCLMEKGLSIVVQTPVWTPRSEASHHPVGEATFNVAVAEIPDLNRTGEDYLRGQDLAQYIAYKLNLKPIDEGQSVLALGGTVSLSFEQEKRATVTLVAFKFHHQLTNPFPEP